MVHSEDITIQELMHEQSLVAAYTPSPSFAALDFSKYRSGYSEYNNPLIENCRNCGAPPEPVCCYCGTVHDGKTYKQRNLPPPPPMTEAEEKFWIKSQMGIQLHNPSAPFFITF